MVSLKNRSKGFTIVELLIVIVVIAILATLVIVTFTGIQQKARDSQRQTDINALDSHIEAYYAEKGNYPTIEQIQDSDWLATNMKGLDPEALVDPKGHSLSGTTATSTTDYTYGYHATHDDGTTACTTSDTDTDDTNCSKFTLSARLEGSSTIYTKSSN